MSAFVDLSSEPEGFIIMRWKFAARFLEVLHSAIRKTLRERTDDIVEGEALQLGSGWLHIHGRLLFSVCYPSGVRVECLKLSALSLQINVISQLSVELAIQTISSRLYASRKEGYVSRSVSYLFVPLLWRFLILTTYCRSYPRRISLCHPTDCARPMGRLS